MGQLAQPDRWQKLRANVHSLSKKVRWATRLTGVLASVLSMHILVVRPLVDRVDRLQAELHYVDTTLSKVAGERLTVRETNNILSGLKEQHDDVAGARATVRQLHQLRREIQAEAEQIQAALDSVSRMRELSDSIQLAEMVANSSLMLTLDKSSPASQLNQSAKHSTEISEERITHSHPENRNESQTWQVTIGGSRTVK